MLNINVDCGGKVPGSCGAGHHEMNPQNQIMMLLFGLIQLLSIFSGRGLLPIQGGFGGRGGGYGGGSPSSDGITNFLGAGPGFGGGGAAPVRSPQAPVNPGVPSPHGTPGAAVDLARRYLGRDSIGLRGDMPHFTAAGGVTNNCVDFVSSALESQGLVEGHHTEVKAFERALISQGYRRISGDQAQPGDVCMNASRGHTELVAAAGGTRLIGSNGSARQRVSEHQNNPNTGVYYTRRR